MIERLREGFSQADADEVFGDQIEGVVSWQGNRDVSSLAGKPSGSGSSSMTPTCTRFASPPTEQRIGFEGAAISAIAELQPSNAAKDKQNDGNQSTPGKFYAASSWSLWASPSTGWPRISPATAEDL